jgi:hypothetical protein
MNCVYLPHQAQHCIDSSLDAAFHLKHDTCIRKIYDCYQMSHVARDIRRNAFLLTHTIVT